MLYQTIDVLGTVAFAISGVLVAMEKRLDLFGVLIIAFVTAIGGGTLRDMMIGNMPVAWMQDLTYVITIFISVVFAIIFVNKLKYLRKSLFLFDTIGIGLYTMVGVEKGLEAGLMPIICVFLGTMTACFGGVIRDMLCNEIPIIFRRKEIYATTCIVGGASYFLFVQFPIKDSYAYVAAILVVISLRLIAVKFDVRLPNIYKKSY
ncbi:trimeric intracellular cation channel family protein [Flagellimonas crocea]|uniref:trimeric intracellular cation channel family protein n=1 Tax=Flagellimonas crocea TaxID=3067311 RepID=UPI00296E8EC4|nr:trimeric intracellular cation channel family protein [Muricauda sp. DH64]